MKKAYITPVVRTIEGREITTALGPAGTVISPGAGEPPGD